MARDLPSERPKFDRARDTPGRDAYAMRVAARAKTKKMLRPVQRAPQTTNRDGGLDEALTGFAKSTAKAAGRYLFDTLASGQSSQRPGRSTMRRTVNSTPLRAGLAAAETTANVIAGPETAKALRGRDFSPWLFGAEMGMMAFPGGPGKGRLIPNRPIWRAATANPEWEIIRNKKYDVIVGMMGRKQKLYGSHRFGTAQVSRSRQVLRNLERRGAAPGPPATNPADQAAYYEAAINQARRDVESAMLERKKAGVDWDFSAVPTGTRQPHASISMQVSPDETYVDFLGALTKTVQSEGDPRNLLPYTGATYDPLEVPPSVLSQLMMQALIPRRNLKAFVINDELEKFIFRMQRKGLWERLGIPNIEFTQENPWQSGTMR